MKCRRYVPRYCSQATDIRSHRVGGGDGAGEAVAYDWLVGESNNLNIDCWSTMTEQFCIVGSAYLWKRFSLR